MLYNHQVNIVCFYNKVHYLFFYPDGWENAIRRCEESNFPRRESGCDWRRKQKVKRFSPSRKTHSHKRLLKELSNAVTESRRYAESVKCFIEFSFIFSSQLFRITGILVLGIRISPCKVKSLYIFAEENPSLWNFSS